MKQGIEGNKEVAVRAYAEFQQAREVEILAEIRRVCGVSAPQIVQIVVDYRG
jgi:hypothetical protein